MRTISAAMSALLSAGNLAQHLRVKVKDSGGTFRDLTTYPGYDMVDSASWGEDVDSPHMTAEVVLKREVDRLSLAPLVETSALNRGFNPAASYAPLIALKREVQIEVALTPMDATPGAGDWMLAFHGRIDSIDWGPEGAVSISARDLGADVMDTFIDEEQVFSFASVSGSPVPLRIWDADLAVTVGDYFIPSEARLSTHFYEVTSVTTGITGSAEPTWPTSGTVVNGGVTFTRVGSLSTAGHDVEDVMQNLLDVFMPYSVTLSTPSSPGWAIRQYKQQREPLLDALRALAMQIGWDVRYRWDGSSAFAFAFYEPDRTKSTPDFTFGADDYDTVTKLALDISAIRNRVRVIYTDATALDATGKPRRTVVEVADSASQAKYGDRFMEIAEEATSQIDTSAEATAMATAALNDLREPKADQEVTLVHCFPFVELGDLYRFSANGRHYSADKDLAVYAYRHQAQEGSIRTTLSCRAQPMAGVDRWHLIGAHPKAGKGTHSLQMFESPSGMALLANPIVGGVKMMVDSEPNRIDFGKEYEFHISDVSGFTPNSATLAGVQKATAFEKGDLIPGRTYYALAVPRIRNAEKLVVGQPTEEVEFIAGQGASGHLATQVNWGRVPLNGGFETRMDPSALPDHWTIQNGILGDRIFVSEQSDSHSGSRCMTFYAEDASPNQSSCSITNSSFELTAGERYRLEFWRRCEMGAGNLVVNVQFFDYDDAFITAHTITIALTDNVDAWAKSTSFFVVPASTAWARINAGLPSTIGDERRWSLDSVTITPYFVGAQEPWVEPGSLLNSWANFGSGFAPASYFKDSLGIVHLRGVVKDGSFPDDVFVLPAGYRPSHTVILPVMSNAALGEVRVHPDGRVVAVGGNNAWLALDGVDFRVG